MWFGWWVRKRDGSLFHPGHSRVKTRSALDRLNQPSYEGKRKAGCSVGNLTVVSLSLHSWLEANSFMYENIASPRVQMEALIVVTELLGPVYTTTVLGWNTRVLLHFSLPLTQNRCYSWPKMQTKMHGKCDISWKLRPAAKTATVASIFP